MYPSGKWRGYWEQNGFGRQEMFDLVLRFDGNHVDGTGWDIVGKFAIDGTVGESFDVTLNKQYIGKHSVLYYGSHDGEGTIHGLWSLSFSKGKFAIRPTQAEVPPNTAILEIRNPA